MVKTRFPLSNQPDVVFDIKQTQSIMAPDGRAALLLQTYQGHTIALAVDLPRLDKLQRELNAIRSVLQKPQGNA